MTAYLEVDFTRVVIMHMPDDTYFVFIKNIADGESEIIGIDLAGIVRRLEGEGDLPLTLVNQLKLGIARKTVTGQVIFLPSTRYVSSLTLQTIGKRIGE